MPSYYDEKAKCRVGEMDEKQFYSECDRDNARFFKSLIADWTKAGGTLKWGAGGVGLRAAISGSGKQAKEVGLCFLAPKFAGKQDRIELSCTALAKQIGEAAVKALQDGLHGRRRSRQGHDNGRRCLPRTGVGKIPEGHHHVSAVRRERTVSRLRLIRPAAVYPCRPYHAHGNSTPNVLLNRLVKLACATVAARITRCSAVNDCFKRTITSVATVESRLHWSVNRRTSRSMSV